jgi:hypothetical protein
MFDSGEAIIKIGKFSQRDWVSGIQHAAKGLIFFRCLFAIRRSKAVHLRQERFRMLRQINNACVEGPPFALITGLRALVVNDPIHRFRRRRVVKPDFASF